MDHDGGRETRAATAMIASWPKGSFVESLAVDADGLVFVTQHTNHAIDRVDPRTGEVLRFAVLDAPVAGLVFARDGTLYASGGQPGSSPGIVWRINREGSAERIATLSDALFLNGMALHPDRRRLLVAESLRGMIYVIDPGTGASERWFAHPDLTPAATDPMTPGANGIKLHRGFAIITVTGRDSVVRVAVAPDGTAGRLERLAERLRGDDFAVGSDGALYIATHPARSLLRLALDGTRTTLATAADGMTGATAVAFGRGEADRHCVYVTTTGGTMTLPADQLEPARLLRVEVESEGAA